MIVRTLASVLNTAAHVKGDAFESRRILLAADGLGYSLHDTICKAGSVQRLEYKNHVETNYVIEGQGSVTNEAAGEVWPLGPGTGYVLDRHEAHVLCAKTDLRIICVFTPALSGQEKHDASGSYPTVAGVAG
jgi:L-ectoine synthase